MQTSEQPNGNGTTRNGYSGHGRRPPPQGEDRRDRFKRLGQPRVKNALYSIRLIGNLSDNSYEWEDSQIEAIENALTAAVKATMLRFKKATAPRMEDTFSFVETAKTA